MGEAIVLGLSSYDRSDLPSVSLRNMYYEQAPTNLEDQVALIDRPRLKQFAVVGSVSIVPPMAANNAPAGYLAAASSEYNSPDEFKAFRAFDGDTVGNNNARWLANASTGTLQLDLPDPITFVGYRIYNSAGADDEENPGAWTLEGWNGSAWVTLDTVAGQAGWTGVGVYHDFTLGGAATASKLKWSFTANQGAPYVTIQEIELIGAGEPVGDGPMMGLYREGGVIGGAILALRGDQLFKVVQTGVEGVGASTLIGTVEGGGLRMTAEGNTATVVLTTGTKLYSTNGTSLAEISFPDDRDAYAVDTLNNYFIVASEIGRFYWSSIGGTTFDALDYATAENQPDGLMTLKVLGDELWLLGRTSVEVWQPTGDLDLPFQRIDGRIFGIGITARDTCQKFNVGGVDKMVWLGTDRRVYWTNPNPEQISDASLDEILRSIPLSITDNSINPYACGYSWDSHDFYVLHIPGHGSKVFDLKTGRWADADSWEHDFFRVGVSAIGPNNQPLLGDDTTNRIWELSTAQRTDGDDDVVFEFTGLVEVPGAPVRCNNVMLDTVTGSTSDYDADPTIVMQTSDDMGRTWDEPQVEYLGRMGQRNERVMWSRQGMLANPGRIFRWRTTEPITVRKAKYNESYRR